MARSYKYAYKVRIQRETQPVLADLASDLGFINETPGARYGDPSPASLLDEIAAAYRANPDQVIAAFRSIGVEFKQQE